MPPHRNSRSAGYRTSATAARRKRLHDIRPAHRDGQESNRRRTLAEARPGRRSSARSIADRIGLRRRYMAGVLHDRPLFDGQGERRCAVRRNRFVGSHRRETLARAAVHGCLEQHERRHGVHLPDIMAGQLIVPPVIAGLQIDRHDRSGERLSPGRFSPARPAAAVTTTAGGRSMDRRRCITRGIAHADVDHPEIGIDRRRRHTAPPPFPGLVVLRPGLVAALAGTRRSAANASLPV